MTPNLRVDIASYMEGFTTRIKIKQKYGLTEHEWLVASQEYLFDKKNGLIETDITVCENSFGKMNDPEYVKYLLKLFN